MHFSEVDKGIYVTWPLNCDWIDFSGTVNKFRGQISQITIDNKAKLALNFNILQFFKYSKYYKKYLLTWKSCGLSDSSYLAFLIFLLPPLLNRTKTFVRRVSSLLRRHLLELGLEKIPIKFSLYFSGSCIPINVQSFQISHYPNPKRCLWRQLESRKI